MGEVKTLTSLFFRFNSVHIPQKSGDDRCLNIPQESANESYFLLGHPKNPTHSSNRSDRLFFYGTDNSYSQKKFHKTTYK